ncbi:PMA1 stabilization in the Golgi protein 1 [Trichomonascus vanleenenianus]|uniref:Psg1p n=1 Tax=Trichomonascus vanleenenianus TaxID=2268995 RepID=UPI003ECAF821
MVLLKNVLLYAVAFAASAGCAQPITTPPPSPPQETGVLDKRAAVPKKGFVDKRPASTTSQESLSPWIRTVSGEVELVTPTVIDGITFSASPKPLKTPPPWVSLKKDGTPKTISPRVKGGETRNPWPDYDTWFDTPVTVTHDLSEKIKDHKGEKYHVEIKNVPEDNPDWQLNPLIRCTPDRYFNTGGGKKNSDPFCTPNQNSLILLDKVHWITWYTRFFDKGDKVRLHLVYVEDRGEPVTKRSLGKRGTEVAFFTTEWMENKGYFPLEIERDWLMDEYEQMVVLSIQSKSMDDEEFDLLNGTILRLRLGPTVKKPSKEDYAKLELHRSEDGFMMAFLTIPTVLLVFCCAYLLVVWYTKDIRKISGLKPRSRRLRKGKYERLPSNTYELEERRLS